MAATAIARSQWNSEKKSKVKNKKKSPGGSHFDYRWNAEIAQGISKYGRTWNSLI